MLEGGDGGGDGTGKGDVEGEACGAAVVLGGTRDGIVVGGDKGDAVGDACGSALGEEVAIAVGIGVGSTGVSSHFRMYTSYSASESNPDGWQSFRFQHMDSDGLYTTQSQLQSDWHRSRHCVNDMTSTPESISAPAPCPA